MPTSQNIHSYFTAILPGGVLDDTSTFWQQCLFSSLVLNVAFNWLLPGSGGFFGREVSRFSVLEILNSKARAKDRYWRAQDSRNAFHLIDKSQFRWEKKFVDQFGTARKFLCWCLNFNSWRYVSRQHVRATAAFTKPLRSLPQPQRKISSLP